jgi:hypothetical protein
MIAMAFIHTVSIRENTKLTFDTNDCGGEEKPLLTKNKFIYDYWKHHSHLNNFDLEISFNIPQRSPDGFVRIKTNLRMEIRIITSPHNGKNLIFPGYLGLHWRTELDLRQRMMLRFDRKILLEFHRWMTHCLYGRMVADLYRRMVFG